MLLPHIVHAVPLEVDTWGGSLIFIKLGILFLRAHKIRIMYNIMGYVHSD